MKKSYLLTVAVLITAFSFAQLTVRNDAFIFVDGAGFNDDPGVAPLFVTNEVNLVEADSKIYLRNEAQLIQGSTIENSGDGQLSVYQRGTVSQFNYNYWCSPVGNTIPGAPSNINTNFIPNNNIYGRDLTSLTASTLVPYTTDFDGTANPFVISNRWIYTYNPGAVYADWDFVGSNGTTTLPGYGFTMKGVAGQDVNNNPAGNNQLYDFRGRPNTGEITVPVLAPIGGVPQFTLMGNPYPSALDTREFFHSDPENQLAIGGTGSGALLFWEQNSSSHEIASYIGGYGVFTIDVGGNVSYIAAPFSTYDGSGNQVGNVGLSPNSNDGVNAPGRYLPVGQGFMVEGATNNNVYFRNSYRAFKKETSGESHFFRTGNNNSNNDIVGNQDSTTSNPLPSNYMRFKLLFDIEYNSNYFTRELLVNMVDYATEAYDYGMEAKLPEVLPSDAHFICNNVPFGILAVPFFVERTIPMTVHINQNQNVTFRVYSIENVPASQPIYIHDIDNNIFVNLRQQNYSINLDAGEYTNRFEITFQTSETLSTTDITDLDFEVFQNIKNSELTVLNPNGLNIKSINLIDVTGKLVINAKDVGSQSDYRFSTRSLSDGVYVATVTVENNQAITKKVIIKN